MTKVGYGLAQASTVEMGPARVVEEVSVVVVVVLVVNTRVLVVTLRGVSLDDSVGTGYLIEMEVIGHTMCVTGVGSPT